MKGNGRNGLLVDLIVLFIFFSDGAGGCFGKGKSEAEWLYCLIVAEAEAFRQPECTTH